MICKQEERDLPRALASIKKIADYLVVVDTGSTDRTQDIAQLAGAITTMYTGASKKDDAGNWMLQDFSKARNIAMDMAERTGATWLMWLDADDVLITPDAIKRAMYWAEKECATIWIQSGTTKWVQHRLIRSGTGARFEGRCHEYLRLDGLNIGQLDDALIVHHADPNPGESSNVRNLRILMLEWSEAQTPRTAFYIANTHKDGGRQKEAATWYQVRIDMGEGFRDEWLFSWLYMGRAMRTYDLQLAMLTLENAMKLEPTWMEFRMELAFILFQQKHYAQAVAMAQPAIDAPIQQTVLWREPQMYRDQPARLISFCHESLGNVDLALVFAKLAKEKIGAEDKEWDQRINNLDRKGASVEPYVPGLVNLPRKKEVICVRRPGAIGDVIMTLNLIPALKAANPGKEVWYFSDPSLIADDALGWLMREAGCDQVMASNTFDSWSSRCAKSVDLVGYPLHEGYPNKPMRRHLLEYFGNELGVGWPGMGVSDGRGLYNLPSLTVRRPQRIPNEDWEQSDGDDTEYATIQIKAGWSKYKQWDRWAQVMDALPDISFVVVDQSRGFTLQQSIAVFANARMHIGIDSFCGHLSNYFWTNEKGDGRRVRSVILWGSTQPSAAGYPTNINICHQPPCGPCFKENPKISRMPQGPCVTPPRATYEDATPHQCMENITVDEVVEAIRRLWDETAD
jgi:tetratricopeptide (TPR) repeat protein